MPLKVKDIGRPTLYIIGSVDGRRVRVSSQTSDWKIAELRKTEVERKVHQESVFGQEAVSTFMEAALGFVRSGGESRFVSKVYPFFKGVKLHEINQQMIDRLALQAYPDASPATRLRQWYAPISAIMNYAAVNRMCPPMIIRKPKPGAQRTDWRTPSAISAICAEIDKSFSAEAVFAVGTGARSSEIANLKWENVWLDSSQALLAAGETKTDTPRLLELPQPVIDALSSIKGERVGNVFTTPTGEPWGSWDSSGGPFNKAFNKALREACAAAKEPVVTAHVLRHTWATWYYAATKDIVRLQALGGWASLKMVERYTHLAPRTLGDEVKKFGWNF